MELNIDPQFSVYKLVGRVAHTASLNHRRTMNVISNEIEDSTLVDGAPTRMFAAFQRYSRFLPQMARYRELAKRAESIYVFGIPDIDLPPIAGITYIPLNATDRLAREWFMISYGAEYASALATEEQTDMTVIDPHRVFKGIWTFDTTLVRILAEWLARSINVEPLAIPPDRVDQTRHRILINRVAGRMIHRLTSDSGLKMNTIVRQELCGIVKNVIHPYVTGALVNQLQAV